jgi:beta-glucosidase
MIEKSFPGDFLWGVATASYQLEGAATLDGRGETIWDRFSHTPGTIRDRNTGDVACDHYRRFADDVAMMKEIGLRAYRFSIAWSRVFPEGTGKVNARGLDFYKALVDALLKKGIIPMVTLYHWDLPQSLQDRGGWGNRQTADHFADYAATLFGALGDRVSHWITLNEPWCVAFLGHANGIHAPGYRDFPLAVNVSHHLLLAHAKAVIRFREMNKGNGRIGIALNLVPIYPNSPSAEDERASRIDDGFMNRWFLDPVYEGRYPDDILRLYQERYHRPEIEPHDLELFSRSPVDFLGVNYYMRHLVAKSEQGRLGFEARKPPNAAFTEMGWEIFPEGLSVLLRRLDSDYRHPEIFITENGIALKDDLRKDGRVQDDARVSYLRDHFAEAHRAMQSGVKVRGYFIWTLMDCFEWHDGFTKHFGLASVDRGSLERRWKASAYWYRDVIASNGF